MTGTYSAFQASGIESSPESVAAAGYAARVTATSALSAAAKSRGEVFTRRWVVELMLDLVEYTPDRELADLTVVEPAVGSGAFWRVLLERLTTALPAAGHWEGLDNALRGYDIEQTNVDHCRALTVTHLVASGCPVRTAQTLAKRWLHREDFLLATRDIRADLVVGNPPYIRIEELTPQLLSEYRRVAPTMGGRADVFVGFYEHGLDLLKAGGKLAFICADRWMRNAYGRALRGKVVDGFSVDDVIVMHDADAFESTVSAYPAITVISRKSQGTATIAKVSERFGADQAPTYVQWRSRDETRLLTKDVEAAVLPSWHETSEVWPDASPAVIAWLEQLDETMPLLEDANTGTRLGIGIATGSDRVYIRRGDVDVESDRLMPMVTPDAIRSGEFRFTGEHLVSPWTPDGLVDLHDYPRLARYYAGNAQQLRGRSVAKRSGPHWYRTIDRQNFSLLQREMLVMQDMKAQASPVRVPAGYVPHHNLYWIVSTAWDLDALGGLLLSKVVEKQVEAYCVKMRGGTLRFQAQVLRKVRIPRIDSLAQFIIVDLAEAFRARDRERATLAALRAFELDSVPQ